MKPLFLYIMIGLGAIIGRTTIVGPAFLHGIVYDLLIPMVVFVRFNLPNRDAILLILTVGCIMDVISGGPFGLYLTIYLWIFVVIKEIANYFDIKDTMSCSMLVALCVLAENLILCIVAVISGEGTRESLLTYGIASMVWQAFVAALTGPAILKGLEKIYRRLQLLE